MSGPSDASAGSAGGAAGVGFQNQVFAWAASCIVAEESLLGSLVAGAAVTVGAQTGSEVDDVVVLTDEGNGVFVQAKIKLQLSADVESPLAKGLEQAVRQYLVGTVPRPDAVARPVDSARDVVVLCTNQAAPATVRVDLAAAMSRATSHPEGTPLGDQLTKKEGDALAVALAHIRRLWAAENEGAEPAVEDLRKFLKCLRVLTLDVGDGGKDQQAAISVLHRGLEVPADPRTTEHYDRARGNLDRHGVHFLTAYVAGV
jgi:alcohol dehydrogenase class IV